MQSVLNTIAKQANLERILFSPGLKKMYFELAVSAGGAATFKHADSIRNGLTTAIKDLDREKKSLLFCHTHELIPAYDMMIHAAVDMHPVAVLAVRGGKSPAGVYWSDLELLRNGWVVFHTHTLQELYDHLAISYHIYAEKKFSLPVLVIHSSLQHKSMGDWNEKEGINLGAPTGDFSAKKTGPKSFADAFAAMEKKKSPPSLQGEIDKVVPALRDVYQEFGYSLPESGLPYQGSFSANDMAVISQFPADDEAWLDDADFDFIRPLCLRPSATDSLTTQLQQKKSIIIVETEPTPGSTTPPYFADWCAALQSSFNGEIQSATFPVGTTVLKSSELKSITKI